MKAIVRKFVILLIAIFVFNGIAVSEDYKGLEKASVVKVVGDLDNWQLTVNGEPFYIKGVGCGDYLYEGNIDEQLNWCKELGANAIRRWGSSDYDNLILEKGKENKLMVIMGYWLPITMDYGSDEYLEEALLERVEDFVKEYKDYPGLLMWGIGNEVIILGEIKLKEQGINLSSEDIERRRIGFAKYLQKVIERVHELDPNHPVMYAGAGLTALKYIKEYTPDLDIYGINFYGGAPIAYYEWKDIDAGTPYIFTEFGHLGHWEVGKDLNNQPLEPTDEEKAESFKSIWKDYILKYNGSNLGGFAFHLTEKKLGIEGGSATWWGLTYEGYKNLSFWNVRELYTGKEPVNYPPVIKNFEINRNKNIEPRASIRVKGKVYDKENDPLKLKLKIFDVESCLFLDNYTEDITKKGKVVIKAPEKEGTYRLYLFATDNKGNIASANRSFSVSE